MEGLASDAISEENFGVWLKHGATQIVQVQSPRPSDKLNICVIKIINNLLHAYDNYTGKYKFLLNIFNKVTSQVKDYLK